MLQRTEEQKIMKVQMDKESRARRRALRKNPPVADFDAIKQKASLALSTLPKDSPLAPALKAAIQIETAHETVEIVDKWQHALASNENVNRSIAMLQHLRDSAISESVRLHAAKDLLDRAAVDLRQQIPGKTVVNLFSNESTEELMAMLRGLPPQEESGASRQPAS